MMDHQLELKLQAYIDSELPAAEGAQVERLLQEEPEARDLCERLRATAQILAAHEPERVLPATREFYWSRIAQGIERSRPAAAPPEPLINRWLRYLAPVAGAAAGVLAAVVWNYQGPPARSEAYLNEIESSLEEVEVISFYSYSAGMSVVWVDATGD